MIVSIEKRYTPEDLLRMPDGDRYELIDGQLVEKNVGSKASRIGLKTGGMLIVHVDAHGLGSAFGADCGYQIFGSTGNNIRIPDASFVGRGRLPDERIPNGYMRIAPDMVLEVVSPNDEAEEVDQKIEEYLGVGVRLIWIIFPSTRRIMVYRASGVISRLKPGDELSGEDVVPGFACRVDDLFVGV